MFPKPFQFSKDDYLNLQELFPMLGWEKIEFKEKLPWFVFRRFARALAIPHIFAPYTSTIYVASDVLPEKESTRIIVHELAHIFQYQTVGNKGFGLFRPGFILYVYLFLKHGYQNHPMEISARLVEEYWLVYCEKQDVELFHKALEQEKSTMLDLKQKFFQWHNIIFWISILSTFLLQGILFLLSLPGYLLFLIGLVGVFQKRRNGQGAYTTWNRRNG